MGRPSCCDMVDVKKGPGTPDQDIILFSYIQEHGPGNWRAAQPKLVCSDASRVADSGGLTISGQVFVAEASQIKKRRCSSIFKPF